MGFSPFYVFGHFEQKTKKSAIFLRQDVDKFIDADDSIIKQRQKIEYLKQICTFCEDTLKQINNRTFQIKNAIEWKKFTGGDF